MILIMCCISQRQCLLSVDSNRGQGSSRHMDIAFGSKHVINTVPIILKTYENYVQKLHKVYSLFYTSCIAFI